MVKVITWYIKETTSSSIRAMKIMPKNTKKTVTTPPIWSTPKNLKGLSDMQMRMATTLMVNLLKKEIIQEYLRKFHPLIAHSSLSCKLLMNTKRAFTEAGISPARWEASESQVCSMVKAED